MSLTLEPIGFIKTSYKKKYDAPKQAHIEVAKEAKIVLNAQQNFEMALSDLSGFSHIWLIYHFHKNSHWKPKVLPPRKDRTKRGLFATRSPYRPNPIGMSVVCLEEIKGRTLYISNHDLLDGTPILDIKPYLAYSDSHPAASQGWLEENDSADYILEYTELAKEQNQWLLQKGIDFGNELERRLSYDPFPHPYRRITKFEAYYQMRFKEWCADYRIKDMRICVFRFYSGFSAEKQAALDLGNIHKQFALAFKT